MGVNIPTMTAATPLDTLQIEYLDVTGAESKKVALSTLLSGKYPNMMPYVEQLNFTWAMTSGIGNWCTWTQEGTDPYNFHDPTTDADRMTVPAGYGGKYLVMTNSTSGGSVRYRMDFIYQINGTTNQNFVRRAWFDTTSGSVTFCEIVDMDDGDYLRLYGTHNFGSVRNFTTNFAMFRIAD